MHVAFCHLRCSDSCPYFPSTPQFIDAIRGKSAINTNRWPQQYGQKKTHYTALAQYRNGLFDFVWKFHQIGCGSWAFTHKLPHWKLPKPAMEAPLGQLNGDWCHYLVHRTGLAQRRCRLKVRGQSSFGRWRACWSSMGFWKAPFAMPLLSSSPIAIE